MAAFQQRNAAIIEQRYRLKDAIAPDACDKASELAWISFWKKFREFMHW
jgi:hypothetical protein